MPTFRDLLTYLERDGGWEEVPNLVRGRQRTGDHRRYRKVLPDGTILRTRVSHSLDEKIGADLLGHIVREQLGTTMRRFRDVLAGRPPAAPKSDSDGPPEPEPIPAWLVLRLIRTVGLTEDEVRRMSNTEARAAWERYRTRA